MNVCITVGLRRCFNWEINFVFFISFAEPFLLFVSRNIFAVCCQSRKL